MIGESEVMAALRNVYDPETCLSVVDLGLIYSVAVKPDRTVEVSMTLTTPACPAGGPMLEGVDRAVRALPEVADVAVELTFEPRWTPERISPEGRKELGWETA
ncbi:MAG TPA: iron-sulfur cluster assembly protein [Myxococcales bacterium]|nr:iron-sulfur cluster assembly protein [Myxococcales bacterium]